MRAGFCFLRISLLARGVIAGKDNAFLGPFIHGAIGLFVIFTLFAIISFVAEVIRLRRDPNYMRMKERTGIKWKDYKRMKGGSK